jgi:hypothetical protein
MKTAVFILFYRAALIIHRGTSRSRKFMQTMSIMRILGKPNMMYRLKAKREKFRLKTRKATQPRQLILHFFANVPKRTIYCSKRKKDGIIRT